MDIKIITKNDTFLIYKPINTVQELEQELKRLKIQTKGILIYFYDNDADKIVILNDQDIVYAIQQAQEIKKNAVTFYIYYKLAKPIIHGPQESQTISIPTSVRRISVPLLQDRPPIIPIPIPTQTREDKLKEVIDKFIDKMLFDQYEI